MGSKEAMRKWREKKIEELGEEGFKKYLKEVRGRGGKSRDWQKHPAPFKDSNRAREAARKRWDG